MWRKRETQQLSSFSLGQTPAPFVAASLARERMYWSKLCSLALWEKLGVGLEVRCSFLEVHRSICFLLDLWVRVRSSTVRLFVGDGSCVTGVTSSFSRRLTSWRNRSWDGIRSAGLVSFNLPWSGGGGWWHGAWQWLLWRGVFLAGGRLIGSGICPRAACWVVLFLALSRF